MLTNPLKSAERSHQAETLYDLASIVVVWSLLISMMLVLQKLGFDYGFKVWPIGEARNWLVLLDQPSATETAHAFWELDSRNPLSPWWYLAAKPLIRTTPAAFLILHFATSLLLAISSYAIVISVAGGRSRAFAVSLGMLVAVALTSAKVDSIHWNFIGALSFSLIAVVFYSEFLSGGRSNIHFYGASIIAWIIATQTYTIQSGAVFAIAMLSFRDAGGQGLALRLLRSVFDAIPFAAVLGLDVIVWKTTSATGITGLVSLPSTALVVQSIEQGIWHDTYGVWVVFVQRMPWYLIIAVFPVASAISFTLLRQTQDSIRLNDWIPLCGVACCMVAPTIILESTSPLFPPGTRWTMLLQFWTPFWIVSLTSAIAALYSPTWRPLIACSIAIMMIASLGMNNTQVRISSTERQFFAALRIVALADRRNGISFPREYLIVDKALTGPSDYVAKAYSRTELGDIGEISYRYVDASSAPNGALIWDGNSLAR